MARGPLTRLAERRGAGMCDGYAGSGAAGRHGDGPRRCAMELFEYTVVLMNRDAPVILARDRALRRVKGMPDTLTLRLEARVPPGLQGGAVVVEQRLTRRDVSRMLAAFDAEVNPSRDRDA